MSSISIQVTPANSGNVNVQVFNYSSMVFNWQGVATAGAPLNQSWDDLPPGPYAVTLSWTDGYHNIASGGGSGISFNGNALYFQALGQATQDMTEPVSVTVGMQLD